MNRGIVAGPSKGRSLKDDRLIQSGPETREWLRKLREDLFSFEYQEAIYYASFRGKGVKGVFAYLNPARHSIRLFVRLDPGDDDHLTQTPSSHHWAERFPTLFTIRRESDLAIARRIIQQSHLRARRLS